VGITSWKIVIGSGIRLWKIQEAWIERLGQLAVDPPLKEE
jgi:hypothetical protein